MNTVYKMFSKELRRAKVKGTYWNEAKLKRMLVDYANARGNLTVEQYAALCKEAKKRNQL